MGRPVLVSLVLLVVGVGVCALSLTVGPSNAADGELREVVLQLRAARTAVAFLAGAALSVGGVIVQGLFRNPLASPSILGTTGGASLGGKLSLLFFQALATEGAVGFLEPEMLLPVGCLLGAALALVMLLTVARVYEDPVTLLLSGFLLSALFLAVGSFVTSVAQQSWELGRAVISFALGSVSGAGERQVAVALPLVLAGVGCAVYWSRALDMMLSGEDEARVLGVNVRRVRRWCIAWTALLTAGAVAIGGNVGFVGLVVPHGLRPFTGVAHRGLIPAAALGGGAFLVACDVLTRAIESQSEIPLGVVTGLLGAPLFLWLLVRGRRFEEAHG